MKNDPRSHQIFEDQIDMRRITRNVEEFRHRMCIDRQYFDSRAPQFMGLNWETYYDDIAQRMILELQAKIATKKFAVKTVRFPDGAWQACKHALSQSGWIMYQFVRAWLIKHPVRYVEVTMEASAYHPDVAIPDHTTFVDIAMMIRRDGRDMGRR